MSPQCRNGNERHLDNGSGNFLIWPPETPPLIGSTWLAADFSVAELCRRIREVRENSRRFAEREGILMRQKFVAAITVSVLALSTLRAQDANVVADNIEFSRDFYSGVHFSAIAESKPSFGYQRYPDNGPERIQCDQGTFARKQRGKPWLRSEDWGESGRPVDKQTAGKLDSWVKLVEAVFNFTPSEVKLVRKSRVRVSVEWAFDARAAN